MTDRYAVIGNPIAHSKSPLIHAEFALQTRQDISYTAVLATRESFVSTVLEFARQGGKGMNVTIPFKEQAWKHLATDILPRAASARAVNTLKFEDAKIIGDNTDGVGLLRDIEINLGFPVADRRVLLMGAGGAARGVLPELLRRHPASLNIVNRNVDKARELQEGSTLSGILSASDYRGLSGRQFDLLINSTSSSMKDELPPLPKGIFAKGALAYDLMYGKGLTPFLRFAQEHGAAKLADGYGMLVEQAAESFLVWRGVRPETRPVIAMLRADE
ncbi:MAG TPA: shikimate dehydrogenase [Burkholderiales bacterium]|nr:shikimate dehydrogenase [Burkholderiales bacterium]